MKHSPSWEALISSASQKRILKFLYTQWFIELLEKARHWFQSWGIQFFLIVLISTYRSSKRTLSIKFSSQNFFYEFFLLCLPHVQTISSLIFILIFTFPCIMSQYTKMINKMQLCRIIYYSLAALHVSSSKHVEQPRNNKLSYTVGSCWSFSYIILVFTLTTFYR